MDFFTKRIDKTIETQNYITYVFLEGSEIICNLVVYNWSIC